MEDNGKFLSPKAYEEIPGSEYPPYIAKTDEPREFTARGLLTGVVFGIIFGAANAYLGLRVGLTISTSIPIAVLTVIAFMALPPRGRIGSILEANISQTVGSASSSLASGMIFTMPALFLWGMNPSLSTLIVVSISGGLLGILFMIPLRRFLIRGEHGKLPYPEGTACAEVLVAADRGGADAAPIFKGILAGGVFKVLGNALGLWKSEFSFHVPFIPKAELGLESGPALLGVGYILGLRIASVMVGGGLLAWLVIIPCIAVWGADRSIPLYPETVDLIRDMEPGKLWTRYVRYIGAGAVACAGILTLIKSIPTIWESFKVGMEQLKKRANVDGSVVDRTDTDLSMKTVLIGVGVIVVFLAVSPQVLGFVDSFGLKILIALLMAVFAFFFVTVSSRIVGLVGVTSNPTSGMTIATLLATSGIFLFLGFQGPEAMAQALIVGAVVATAASIAGDTSQDLKSGFLLGATPWRQQIGEIIGVLTSVTFVALAVFALHKSIGFGTKELPAPQATLMKLVIEGVLSQSLPWGLVMIGAGLSLIAALFRLPTLAFAVGIYLPVSTMTPVFVGGLIRYFVEKHAKKKNENLNLRRERGILFGSGLVGGEGLVGVGVAIMALIMGRKPDGFGGEWAGPLQDFMPLIMFSIMAFWLYRTTVLKKKNSN